jgi:hypothetical protein
MDQQFWMVWCPQGSSPTAVHASGQLAINEAERLANMNPGKRFYVVKALRYVQKTTTNIVELPAPSAF